jgi:hypothetical protein
MDGEGSYLPGSMPAFDRASRGGRFDEEGGEGGSEEEEEDDVGRGYFSKRVRGVRWWCRRLGRECDGVCVSVGLVCGREGSLIRGVLQITRSLPHTSDTTPTSLNHQCTHSPRPHKKTAMLFKTPTDPPFFPSSPIYAHPPTHTHSHTLSHTHTHTRHINQAIPAGLEMEIALMREERERDKRLKEE